MEQTEAAQLDDQDRRRKEALHHHGLVAHEADRLWRQATVQELFPVLECRPERRLATAGSAPHWARRQGKDLTPQKLL